MDRELKIYDLHDPRQYEDEKRYWADKTIEEKLHTLEVLRKAGSKLLSKSDNSDADKQGFRRVLRIVK